MDTSGSVYVSLISPAIATLGLFTHTRLDSFILSHHYIEMKLQGVPSFGHDKFACESQQSECGYLGANRHTHRHLLSSQFKVLLLACAIVAPVGLGATAALGFAVGLSPAEVSVAYLIQPSFSPHSINPQALTSFSPHSALI